MHKPKRVALAAAIISGVFAGTLAGSGQAQEAKFQHVMSIGTEGVGPGQFKYVEDFAFSAEGHLLVTDAAHAYVQIFDKTTGEYISRFGGRGDDDHQLEKPEGISVDSEGNIFVADYSTGYVKKYDRNFNWLMTFSDYGDEPGENIKSEFTDIYDGRYYLPEAGNHRVSVFDLDGNFLLLIGGPGTAPGKFNNPESAKFNSTGTMYVADLKNDRVQAFDKNGKYLFTWGGKGDAPGQFLAPAGLGIDKNDNVYVSEIGNNRIQVFDKNGRFLTMWGGAGSGSGQFDNLHGVIVDKTTGWVYVADTANNRIQVFKPTGDLSG